MDLKTCPIAFFDSGVGGISVLKEAVKLMPYEDYIYFGDSKNAPYGTKTLEEVQKLSTNNTEILLEKGAKAIVIACNTATSAAAALLRKTYPDIPIIGIEPALKPAAISKEHVLVMATPMTIHQDKFHHLMARYEDDAQITPLPCPGLMDFVERGDLDSPELKEHIANLLAPYTHIHYDAIVLGCTHYPFLKDAIKEVIGYPVEIYDGGLGTSRELCRQLTARNITNDPNHQGHIEFINSLEDSSMIALCKKLLED